MYYITVASIKCYILYLELSELYTQSQLPYIKMKKMSFLCKRILSEFSKEVECLISHILFNISNTV